MQAQECPATIEAILLLGGVAFIVNSFAYLKGFFKLPLTEKKRLFVFLHVLGCFCLYFFTFIPLAHLLFQFLSSHFPFCPKTTLFAYTQLFSAFFCFFLSGCFQDLFKKTLLKLFAKTRALLYGKTLD